MTDKEWTPEDFLQIADEGLTPEQVLSQLEKFRQGTTPVRLLKPCRPGDGIVCLTEEMKQAFIAHYDAAAPELEILKFVPASGAATRMFKDWFGLLERRDSSPEVEQALHRFAETIHAYAFGANLEQILRARKIDLDGYLRQGKIKEIMAFVLGRDGLNYGNLPKALLTFHQYADKSRTALEEHFVEAAGYARSRDGICRLHFTVSEEFQKAVARHVGRVIGPYQQQHRAGFQVDFSIQKPSTNTLAVDLQNRPFRNDQGKLVFRPAGHGALLYNLSELDADLVFIKNIDNVSHDRLLPEVIPYKKALAGYLLKLQEQIFRYLKVLSEPHIAVKTMEEIRDYSLKNLQLSLPVNFRDRLPAEQKEILFNLLNRPIRICGMVKNTGEPGGGPFWVVDEQGQTSRQIIEQFQIDAQDEEQLKIWSSSTHFNPVDLVCSIKDFRGRKFNLFRYADQNAVCISVKSEKGRSLKALELPGLWNGAMAHWITIFVEVPIITFNPVKTVEDLLRKEHLPA
ncbi:MAG TPA: DUF4301 family protein [Syntrophales bacterium]|nr:DUF4301 family protein [Syntrophales bacterium]